MKSKIRFIITGFCFLLACNETGSVKDLPKKYTGPMLIVHDVTTLYSDSGLVKVKLSSPLEHDLQDKNREFPKGLKLEFYNEKKEISSTLTANYGIYIEKDDKYIVRRNVKVKNIEGKKLYSEELFWNPQTRKIISQKFVKIETHTDTLSGIGLESNETFTKYKILKPTGKFTNN